ncbi:MAG: transglutaminase-like putative cysteine protease [Flavobacteriales bacterium]|jgi:transglutaminase-like putative cysteine protease
MAIKKTILLVLVFISITTRAQKTEYSALNIADSLKDNANAVVRLNQIDIFIMSQRDMKINTLRVITVLNEKGLSAIDAVENYNRTTVVKDIEATVYDILGKEIKKIKRKDFKDESAVGGSTLFSDSRYLYLDYTPIQYPFTVVYKSELQTSTTAFIPQWYPFSNYYVSVEKSVLNVTYPDNLGFKKKEFNFKNFSINKILDTATQLSYTASNLPVQKLDDYSPSFSSLFPKVMMGLEEFHLEGVDGKAKTWKEFGEWYFREVLSGTTALSEETKAKMKVLVGDEKDPIKKARLIYDYVQKKSRYVSIQVGIGGWKPMLATDVDRLGYGDCKALTNYTKALLAAVDVPSYNVVLYGDSTKKNIETDFVSMQGNHMILAIPNGTDYTWLECTSQDDPFGFQGNFTDDRDVLVVKPEGGEIVHTNIYDDKNNSQVSTGSYALSASGDLTGTITIVSRGSQFVTKASIENEQPIERDNHYKLYWRNINNLKIISLAFTNDKTAVSFTEKIALSAANYGNLSVGKMLFAVNAYNQYLGSVKRIRNRKNSFEIQRGFLDVDQISIALPKGFTLEFLPANYELKTKFGEYTIEFIKKENNSIIYKRSLFVKKGLYTTADYDNYRLFIEQVSKNDNAKMILTQNK